VRILNRIDTEGQAQGSRQQNHRDSKYNLFHGNLIYPSKSDSRCESGTCPVFSPSPRTCIFTMSVIFPIFLTQAGLLQTPAYRLYLDNRFLSSNNVMSRGLFNLL
jgi:hypothetical protein